MPALGRTQLIVYSAVAVAILLLGARWIGGAGSGSAATQFGGPPPAGAAESGSAEPPDGLEIDSLGGGGLVVHVAGAVRRPGVYRFAAGARVTDAIERAGGAEPGAVTDAINLAAALADGQQVVVPDRAATAAAATSGPGSPTASAEAPISLGSATIEQLDTIEGIGPVTAADIIEFRDSQGGVASIDELDQISGIGPATMESLRARLQP